MPIKSTYNDPSIGAAFNNLASLFAPPSGADLQGYSASALNRQKEAQLAQLFAAGASPSEQAALTGIQGYGQTPAGFTYNVDQGNLTQRYGYDTQAATSITNNAADNAGAMARQAALPIVLNQGQVAHLPGQTQDMTGLTDIIMGAPKPLSQTEVMGGIISGLPVEDQTALALNDIDLAQVIMEDGSIQNTRKPDAVGMTPAPTGAEGARKDAVAIIDGQNVPVTRAPSGLSWQTADGRPIPEGVQVFSIPQATGTAEQVGMGTVANQTRANNLYAAALSTEDLVSNLEGLIQSRPGATGLAANIVNFAQNARQVVSELGASVGADPNSPVSAGEMQEITNAVLGSLGNEYDPTFARAHAMLLELAYSNARLNNGGSEVSRAALEREIEALGQGLLGNDQSTLASLSVTRDRINRARIEADALSGRSGEIPAPPAPPAAPTAPTAEGAVFATNPQTGERLQFVNGQWVPAQ